MAILTERRIENMKRIILSCLSLLMLFSMLTPWKTSAKSKSKLNKTSITMYTGTKVKLKLKGTKKKCKWSVNKPQIISVSQKGIVKAKKKGKAKVIAKIKKKKYICKVTVKVKKKQTDKSNSGNKSTPDTSANTNTNTNTVDVKMENRGKEKNKWVAFVLCLFLGVFGAHKFYEGKILMGVIYIFTGGLLLIGCIIDLIAILMKPNPYYV